MPAFHSCEQISMRLTWVTHTHTHTLVSFNPSSATSMLPAVPPACIASTAQSLKQQAKYVCFCMYVLIMIVHGHTCMLLPMDATSTCVSMARTGLPSAAARSRTYTVHTHTHTHTHTRTHTLNLRYSGKGKSPSCNGSRPSCACLCFSWRGHQAGKCRWPAVYGEHEAAHVCYVLTGIR